MNIPFSSLWACFIPKEKIETEDDGCVMTPITVEVHLGATLTNLTYTQHVGTRVPIQKIIDWVLQEKRISVRHKEMIKTTVRLITFNGRTLSISFPREACVQCHGTALSF